MELVAGILYPIIWLMGQLLRLLGDATGYYGVAIIGLGITVRLLMMPIIKLASRIEEREQRVQLAMAPELAIARRELSGRAEFERIEAIYQKHHYHPIHALRTLLPIALQIPFLLAALLLLIDHPMVIGTQFLLVQDLGEPDRLLQFGSLEVNVLPIALTLISIFESSLHPKLTSGMRMRFLVVAAVIAVLIYPLPAAVCLYWMTNNVTSLLVTILRNARASIQPTR